MGSILKCRFTAKLTVDYIGDIMNIEEFRQKVKSAKVSQNNSCFYTRDCHIKCNKEHTQIIISYVKSCERCRHKDKQLIYVKFKNEYQLSIFQCGLIVALYLFNKVISDYHRYLRGYLDCEAGKIFIENIESIKTIG